MSAANAEVQKICDKMKPEVEQKAGKKLAVFTAISYKTQVVAGTSYFIKVQVGDDKFLHLHVYKTPRSDGEKLTLQGIVSPKTRQDPIELF